MKLLIRCVAVDSEIERSDGAALRLGSFCVCIEMHGKFLYGSLPFRRRSKSQSPRDGNGGMIPTISDASIRRAKGLHEETKTYPMQITERNADPFKRSLSNGMAVAAA